MQNQPIVLVNNYLLTYDLDLVTTVLKPQNT